MTDVLSGREVFMVLSITGKTLKTYLSASIVSANHIYGYNFLKRKANHIDELKKNVICYGEAFVTKP